ncbi:hypothetical protein A2U01_0073090, partial [Trifolium medium]|nr:hypothetical protein [Trifolium medium]
MALIGAAKPLKCKLLSGTFKDDALRWYMNLPTHSVTGYADFHKKLIHQFSGSKPVQITAIALFGIRQRHGCWSFLARSSSAWARAATLWAT